MPPVKKAAARKAAPRKKVAAKKVAARRSLPVKIQEMADSGSQFVRWMVYGKPNSGKTVLAASGGPDVLILESDRGEASAVRHGSTSKKWRMGDWNDWEEVYEYLKMGGGTNDFRMVWVDSLTSFQDLGLDHIMEDVVAQPRNAHRKVYAPDKGDFGKNMNRISKMMRDLRDLPIHVGVVCHGSTEVEDEETGDLINKPWIQGKGMIDKVCSYMDIIGHMTLEIRDERVRSVMDCRPSETWYTKDRYGVGRLVNPTVDQVLSLATGGGSGTRPRKKTSASKSS